MLYTEHKLKIEQGIKDEKVQRRRNAALLRMQEKARLASRPFNSLVAGCQRATQRSLQFIRWIRHCLVPSTLLQDALALLRPLRVNYLV